ncbi:polysaccharide deacetylase family protein [Dolosigranulum savutiense]|uniref:Polysaccharide deacetylase family protein n=1 Tax=Dolosigranulum savutiense TaxID=3110288 RepID=A0AB74TPN8_9LACT
MKRFFKGVGYGLLWLVSLVIVAVGVFWATEQGIIGEWFPQFSSEPESTVQVDSFATNNGSDAFEEAVHVQTGKTFHMVETAPRFHVAAIDEVISSAMTELRQPFAEKYNEEMERQQLDSKEPVAEQRPFYQLDYEIEAVNDSVYAITFESMIYNDDTLANRASQVLLVDVEAESVSPLADIFETKNETDEAVATDDDTLTNEESTKDSKDSTKSLVDSVQEALASEHGEDVKLATFTQDFPTIEALLPYMTVNKAGIALTFDAEQVASAKATAETYTVELSWEELNASINDEWREHLDLPELTPEVAYAQGDQPWTPVTRGPASTDGKKRVALTYDDGPGGEETTGRLLKMLEQHNAKATFYMLGDVVEYNPEMAQRVHKAGHEIGNHSWGHPVLPSLGPAGAAESIAKAEESIKKAVGKGTKHYRPPYGERTMEVDEAIGKPAILWSIDTQDWRTRNAQSVFEEVRSKVQDGDIILMHDIHPETIDASALILDYLDSQGFEMVTVSELMGY